MQLIESLINEESELVVLGTLLDNPKSHNTIDKIQDNIFSNKLHRNLFKITKRALSEGHAIDLPLIHTMTKQNNINISITSLTNLLMHSNIYTLNQNIKLLNELYVKRNLYERAELIKLDILESDKDIDKILYDFEEGTKDITPKETYDDSIDSIANRLLDNLEKKQEIGFEFGIPLLDRVIGGVFRGELTTIGAKSGVGKTALALNVVQSALKQNKKVLIVTREMTDEHITQRLITQLTGISAKTMKTKTMSETDWSGIINSLGYLGSKNLNINHNISKPSEIRRRVKELKPDLVIIDYLQLLTSEKSTNMREQEVAHLSREMKKITTDYNTSVIQLTQLNDSFKGRPMGESPIRESKAIYQDSNNVIYIHKPIDENELVDMAKGTKKEASENDKTVAKMWLDMNLNAPTKLYEMIVSKSRDSGTAIEKMWYIGNLLKFEEFKQK